MDRNRFEEVYSLHRAPLPTMTSGCGGRVASTSWEANQTDDVQMGAEVVPFFGAKAPGQRVRIAVSTERLQQMFEDTDWSIGRKNFTT